MVANGASSAKKCPANIRTASVHAPVLVPPISVAQRNKMMETEGVKKSTNWMRDQWVANLKKKRVAAAANGGVMPTTTTDASPAPVHRPAPTTTKRTTNKGGSRARNKTQNQALPSLTQPQMVDKDNLGLMHPALFFNDLGSFEIESQSFMRLTPSRDSAMVHPLMAGTPNGKQSDRKWSKPLIKKRTNSFSLDVTEPKRRTPRRPHSSNASFDDIDSLCLSSSASSSCSSGFSSVGTPSNFSAEVARMWGPEFDFPSAYVDTFLDIPTPKSAATQLLTPRGLSVLENPREQDLEQPKLIRTTSVEQEGLSHYLEHTSIANEGANATNERPKKTAYHITAAAASAVDECFGKTVPLPSPSLRQLLVNGARVQRTPRGFRITPRHSTHEYNFDHTSMPEFETLLDEYKFTDIDQELDSFYLDTIESFGGDLDLISS